MLNLVLSHRHNLGLVQQDVSGLQDRVGEKPCVDVFAVLLGFVLELRHALKIPQRGQAVEYPGEISVPGYLRLGKQRAAVRRQAAGNKRARGVEDALKIGLRLIFNGHGMQVCDEKYAVIALGQRDPVFNCPNIIADVGYACWLNAA